MNKVEHRTTRDGLPIFGGRSIRTDALQPLVEAVRKLGASLDRAVKQAEDARAKGERLTAERRPRTLRQRILGVDHDDD